MLRALVLTALLASAAALGSHEHKDSKADTSKQGSKFEAHVALDVPEASSQKDDVPDVGAAGAAQGDFMKYARQYAGSVGDYQQYTQGSGYQKYMNMGTQFYSGQGGEGASPHQQQSTAGGSSGVPRASATKSFNSFMAAEPTEASAADKNAHQAEWREVSGDEEKHMTKEEERKQKVKEAEKDQAEAAKRTKEAFDKLRDYEGALAKDLSEHKTAVAKGHDIARSIQENVRKDFSERREEAQQAFGQKLTAMAKAASDKEAGEAADGAKAASRELRKLDREENGALRHAYEQLRSAAKRKARELGRQTRASLHEAKKAAKEVEKAQKEVGMPEKVYEQQAEASEHASEKVGDNIEHLSEHAEGLVERQFGLVEHVLESSMDDMEEQAGADEDSRAQALDHAKALRRQAQAFQHSQAHAKAEQKQDVHQATNEAKDEKKAADPVKKEEVKKEEVKKVPKTEEDPAKEATKEAASEAAKEEKDTPQTPQEKEAPKAQESPNEKEAPMASPRLRATAAQLAEVQDALPPYSPLLAGLVLVAALVSVAGLVQCRRRTVHLPEDPMLG